MSHVKNVQAFGKLIGICTGYGGSYKPGQQHLQVNALAALSKSAQQLMDEVTEAQIVYDRATNNRVLGFKDLRYVSAAVCQVLKSSGANALTISDASLYYAKLYGATRIRSKATPQETTPVENQKSRSSRNRNFAALVQHFALLVETVSKEPLYQPTEERLSVTGLKQKLAELQVLNAAAMEAEIQLTSARRLRNEVYYETMFSLFNTAVAVKQYVRGVFGFNSAQHNEMKELRFTKPGA